jgi:pterin-4a-carbinolamine dehydratase
MIPDLNQFKGFDHIIIDVLRRQNVHPVIIYVFKRTGLLLTNHAARNLTKGQIEKAKKVAAEYSALELEMSKKIQ